MQRRLRGAFHSIHKRHLRMHPHERNASRAGLRDFLEMNECGLERRGCGGGKGVCVGGGGGEVGSEGPVAVTWGWG